MEGQIQHNARREGDIKTTQNGSGKASPKPCWSLSGAQILSFTTPRQGGDGQGKAKPPTGGAGKINYTQRKRSAEPLKQRKMEKISRAPCKLQVDPRLQTSFYAALVFPIISKEKTNKLICWTNETVSNKNRKLSKQIKECPKKVENKVQNYKIEKCLFVFMGEGNWNEKVCCRSSACKLVICCWCACLIICCLCVLCVVCCVCCCCCSFFFILLPSPLFLLSSLLPSSLPTSNFLLPTPFFLLPITR